jgi:hypothetical protein
VIQPPSCVQLFTVANILSFSRYLDVAGIEESRSHRGIEGGRSELDDKMHESGTEERKEKEGWNENRAGGSI